ncbi:hypothetical protein Trco_007556 [Trichoderma cornu-damae]|uniref:Zn(2)-C6 fungal-type domain-containing protein n=1 Tax=Trichoderma cornu-damae TaxID=654480 RepID=A0A9P8QJF8_9HYPO|nr:hypothetical protein Trco_007556 [Trichoderma cornu-damae]
MAETSLEGALEVDNPPPKPYHAKRPHKKSRSGCQNCKARKVKCDESRPTCRSCKLREADCVYIYPRKAHISSGATSSPWESPESQRSTHLVKPATSSTSIVNISSTSSFLFSAPILSLAGKYRIQSPTIPTELLYCPTGMDNADMKALWFYATQTCGSFSTPPNEEHRSIMRSLLVRYGSESPFLMDSIFALSSLHMQHLNQQFDAQRALTYRVKALAGYRKAIEEAKPADFPALLANSLLLTALSSSNFREQDGNDLFIIDWLVIWKGIVLVIGLVSKPILLESGMKELFFRPPIDLDKATPFIPNQLLLMASTIRPSDPEYAYRGAYYETLKCMGSLYMDLTSGPSSLMSLRVITIFTYLPREFIDVARMSQPRALVILAYFATFFKLVESEVWWLKGVGDRTIQDICAHIGLEWFDLLQVPCMALGTRDSIQLERIILGDIEGVCPQNYFLGYEAEMS